MVSFEFFPDRNNDGTKTIGSSKWLVMLAAGVIDGVDANILIPSTISGVADRVISRDNDGGDTIIAQLVYDDGDTPSADPDVILFGRFNSSEPWSIIPNNSDERAVTIVTAVATDTSDATNKRTKHINADHAWLALGYKEFFFGVAVAYAVSAGDATLATLEAKIIQTV